MGQFQLKQLKASNSKEVAGAGVGAGVSEFRHGPCFDLANALTGEVEVLANLFEGARLATIETET